MSEDKKSEFKSQEDYWENRGNELKNDLLKKIAKSVSSIESTNESFKFVCGKMGWNDEVCYKVDEALQKLGSSLADLTIWEDDIEN